MSWELLERRARLNSGFVGALVGVKVEVKVGVKFGVKVEAWVGAKFAVKFAAWVAA